MTSERSALRRAWDYLKVRKRWWLAPIILVLLALAALAALTRTGELAPFIYHF